MRVNVWISQLIGDCIQEQVTAFVVQIDCQVLQDVHVSVVDDVRHRRVLALGAESSTVIYLIRADLLTNLPNLIDCLRADVENQSIHQRNIVARSRFVGDLQVPANLGQERDGRSLLQIQVKVFL